MKTKHDSHNRLHAFPTFGKHKIDLKMFKRDVKHNNCDSNSTQQIKNDGNLINKSSQDLTECNQNIEIQMITIQTNIKC